MGFTALRLRPRVQTLPDGKFQPIVVVDDGGGGEAVFGAALLTHQEANDAAIAACNAALPDAKWADGWLR